MGKCYGRITASVNYRKSFIYQILFCFNAYCVLKMMDTNACLHFCATSSFYQIFQVTKFEQKDQSRPVPNMLALF